MKWLTRLIAVCLLATACIGCTSVDNSAVDPENVDNQPAAGPSDESPAPMPAP